MSRRLITAVMAAIVLGATAIQAPPSSADDRPAGGWLQLSAAKDFSAWRPDRHGWSEGGGAMLSEGNPEQLAAAPGAGALVCTGDAANLESAKDFQDVRLACEFMVAKGSNSGVKLNGLYEIQIRDTFGVEHPHGDDCGGVYPRAKLSPRYQLLDAGTPPAKNAARPSGQWQTLELDFYSPRFDAQGKKVANARFENVMLNGTQIHKRVELKWPTGHAWNTQPEVPRGPLLLQGDHGSVAFRNVRVQPLAP
jgi:hypothetical protein